MNDNSKGPKNLLQANIPMDWTFLIVKIVKSNYRECRESYFIEKFNLKFKGINRKNNLPIANTFKKMSSFWYRKLASKM